MELSRFTVTNVYKIPLRLLQHCLHANLWDNVKVSNKQFVKLRSNHMVPQRTPLKKESIQRCICLGGKDPLLLASRGGE